MKAKNKPKIRYGKKDLLPARIDPKDEKVRISIIMEGDLLDALRAHAAAEGKPYQTFMKDLLRSALTRGEQMTPPPKGLGLEIAEAELRKVVRELEERVERNERKFEHQIEDLKKRA
jgi:uncharacterized protein (DUF4415 family)